MAVQAEIIPFNIRSGTGSQTINHLVHTGIAAKGIVFMCADNSGAAGEVYGTGLDDGTTHLGMGIGINDSFGICTARGYSTVYSLVTEQAQAFFGGAARQLSGYVSSISVGSFNITLDVNNTPGAQWYAVIIGGTDVNCKVGLYDISPGSGTVNVGFPVQALLKLGVPDAGTNGEVAGALYDAGFATGCGSGVTDQVGWGSSCDAGAGGASYQIQDIIQADVTSGAGGPSDQVTLSNWSATGFDVTAPSSANWNIGYLAIGGNAVSANLVQIIQPTTTGVQNYPMDAADPVLAFFGSTCKVASASPSLNTNLMFGAYDGSSQVSQWWGHTNGSANRDRLSSTTSAINLATSTGVSTSTVNAAASVSLAPENIAANWTAADATQREVWALVIANNPSVSGLYNPCGVETANTDELTCSIQITAPAEIPSVGIQQWRLHRFDVRIRGEQTS